MFPAARKGDPITHDLVVPSGVIGPPVTGPCPPPCTPVSIEGLPAAHMLCTVVCSGATSAGVIHPPPVPPAPPAPIVVGTSTVLIHGQPAARWFPSGDVSACGVFLGDSKLTATRTVLIGGPGVGASLGNPGAGNAACVAAAAGRPGNSTQQSDNNCGVECARQIINRANGTNINERTLLDQSMNNGDAIRKWSVTGPWYNPTITTNYPSSGGTYPNTQVNILQNNGVPAHNEAATMPNIASAVSAGRGVIVQIDAAPVWNAIPGSAPTAAGAWHAVVVTGVQYNANGQVVSVTINDTGALPPNNCQQTVPMATFQAAMSAYQAAPGTSTNSTVVTNNKVF
jgi:hypothetical protein